MPDIERYTPAQLEDEVQSLAEGYVSAVGELGINTEIFEDISEAIQSKTGQVEPYDKSEIETAIINELIKTGLLPNDTTSLSHVELGIDENGLYWTDEVNGGTPILLGVDAHGLYMIGGNANAE